MRKIRNKKSPGWATAGVVFGLLSTFLLINTIAAQEPDRCVIIDATQKAEKVHEDIMAEMCKKIGTRLS